jgi:hypothetical protein
MINIPTLTNEKEQIKAYLNSMREFVCAQSFAKKVDVKEVAGRVIVDMGTGKTVKELLHEIFKKVPRSQTFEEWEFDFASEIHEAAEKLGAIYGEALLAYSGYADADFDDLYQKATEAGQEARNGTIF